MSGLTWGFMYFLVVQPDNHPLDLSQTITDTPQTYHRQSSTPSPHKTLTSVSPQHTQTHNDNPQIQCLCVPLDATQCVIDYQCLYLVVCLKNSQHIQCTFKRTYNSPSEPLFLVVVPLGQECLRMAQKRLQWAFEGLQGKLQVISVEQCQGSLGRLKNGLDM